ncbi:hypothetical protein QBC45DRAFT_147870 [Copromyces sp. CBS 386.78]|nr:hypothetical protein QBC45DRAFT_147870 [Copromyces sp. CBS 386.78]
MLAQLLHIVGWAGSLTYSIEHATCGGRARQHDGGVAVGYLNDVHGWHGILAGLGWLAGWVYLAIKVGLVYPGRDLSLPS